MRLRSSFLTALLVGLGPLSLPAAPAFTPDTAGFESVLRPFLRDHCLRCHGPEKQSGEFRVDTQLPNQFLDPAAKEKWGEVVNVLNGHEMPPRKEPQPQPAEAARVVDWITAQLVRAELIRRDGVVVLRRLNREEYRNSIRELTGVDYDVAGFPLDPLAGGFDNNGKALTLSPVQLELYVEAAQQILRRALVEGPAPVVTQWRFQPETGDGDRNRVRLDKENNAIVHGAKNEKRGEWTVMHHASWDRNLNARDFRVPVEGEYVIRVRAAGRVPGRDEVVASARRQLEARIADSAAKNPKQAEGQRRSLERDLEHFQRDRLYDYGPPRLKLIQDLGGQPRVLAEFDVDAPLSAPKVYEFRARFTREKAGLTLEYAYALPAVLENFWMQGRDTFARPEAHVDWFELAGPVTESWPPPSHQRILFPSPLAATDERAYAREVLRRFMRRAYRRPVTAAEVEAKLALYDAARPAKPSLVQAIQPPLIAVLASPHFLFLTEPAGAATPASRALNDHELAARLSYFLWSGPPDEALAQAAESGRLRSPDRLRAEVDRLLADPRAEAFVRNFAGQWLGLREVGANPPAKDLYPQYDRHLEASMVGEAQAFFAEILRHDLDVRNFIRSEFVVINERLARFYGIDGVRGDQFRRVPLPAGVPRGGVLTQAAMLSLTSNGTRTSPVKRGTWVMKNLLGTDPGLPVANVGDIQPKVPGIDKATVRQRLEIHRELPQCARCHDRIDPLGLALENFNAAGEWRTQEGFGYKGRVQANDPVINAAARLPDGTEFTGVAGLQAALLKQDDLFLRCLAGKLFTYALGRELGVADQPMIQAAAAGLKQSAPTLRALIHTVVTSPAFTTK